MRGQKRKRRYRWLAVLLFLVSGFGARCLAGEPDAAEEGQSRPEIVITPEQANRNGYYHKDVSVKIKVEGAKAGLKKAEYRITGSGQENVPWQVLYAWVEGETFQDSLEKSILVDATAHDSEDVKIWVRVTEQDGAEYETEEAEACSLKICTASPEVKVRIDGVLHQEAKAGYYNTPRKAEVIIFDRADVFDEEAATKAVRIGRDGQKLSPRPDMVSAWTSRGDRHSAVITFSEDGKYQWEVSGYKNLADLGCTEVDGEGASLYDFTVDTKPPLTSDVPDRAASWIGYREKGWSKLAGAMHFSTWEKSEVTVLAEGKDTLSPLHAVKYYKTNGAENPAFSREVLDVLYESGAFTEEPYTIKTEEQCVIYARLTDYAGNTSYISTEGIIVDQTAGGIELSIPQEPNTAGYYSDDVQVKVSVNDLEGDDTAYSGIRTIDYTIYNPDTRYTETGNLYTFDKHAPEKAELRREWAEEMLVVDAEKFDAEGVTARVTVTDNAGNESSDLLLLNICKYAPEITVEFSDKPNREAEGRGYFGKARNAVVTVRDREDLFDAEAVKIQVCAVDSGGGPIPLDEAGLLSAWSHEGRLHTAELYFWEEGNYEFSLSYKNKADLPGKVTYMGAAPQKFTVDRTAPEGSVTIKRHTWKELLSVLTFGLYSNTEAEVTAAAGDTVSPVTIEYYKTDESRALTAEELAKRKFEPYPKKGFTVLEDEQLVVYLKLTDYAGNAVYLSSDGYIVDMTRSRIELLPKTGSENGIYCQDVKVAVKIHDPKPYSGIQAVRYEVRSRGELTQSGDLYIFEKKNPAQSELMESWESSILVNAEKNNSCHVTVSVFVRDNAGNETEEFLPLDIDVTPPEIEIIYAGGLGYQGSRYYNTPRHAVIRIRERTHHFRKEAAEEGLWIQARDAAGRSIPVEKASMISEWKTEEGEVPDEAVHTAELTFDADGNYRVSVSYRDQAGNDNTPADAGNSFFPWRFTVDRTAPGGIVTAKRTDGEEGTRTKSWENEWADEVRFGFWSGKTITVTGKAYDETSPVKSIFYYKTEGRTALRRRKVKKLAAGKWKDFRGKIVKIVPNEQAVIYMKITDRAGNVAYLSSGGILADKDKPRMETFSPQVTIWPEQPVNGCYRDDVTVDLVVRDDSRKTKEPCSGLKTIRYEVINSGEKTQSGILYSFEREAPKRSELKKSWSGRIKVDSRKNNSNRVVIKVYAEDNAGNVTTSQKKIKIDVTPPQIMVSYDNNSPVSGRYYSSDRTATVTVIERNFSAKDVAVRIMNSEGKAPEHTEWREEAGSGNGDDTKHIAVFTCHADGDYTLEIEGRDLAGNRCSEVIYAEGTENPSEFTIDQTPPVITVRYDNNEVRNEKYFKEKRTGTVTIKEHNFDQHMVRFTRTASLDGKALALPQPRWSSHGDVHTAVFSYIEDGDYTFDASMTDLAGNSDQGVSHGASRAATAFTIDTGIEKLEITGIENGKSYQDTVIPFISYEDINLEKEEIRLFRTRRDEKNVDVTEEFLSGLRAHGHGAAGRNDTFAKTAENDGIYRLLVKISDLAGNEKKEEITFTVNRFGSVYVFGEELLRLMDSYTQEIEEKLVITEYNPDPLVEKSLNIQITRDGVPVENINYSVAPVPNEKVPVGESGWYQYQYEISPENFRKDGIYRLSVTSKDQAGNASDTLNSAYGQVTFCVDTTPPEITDITGLEKAVVSGKTQEICFSVFDAIGCKQVTAYVDDVKAGIYRPYENQVLCSGSFTLQEGTDQSIRFVAEDLAGNITDTDQKDKNRNYIFRPDFPFVRSITVSASMLVRWYADGRLFWGIFGGAAAAGGLVLGKKKRKGFLHS